MMKAGKFQQAQLELAKVYWPVQLSAASPSVRCPCGSAIDRIELTHVVVEQAFVVSLWLE